MINHTLKESSKQTNYGRLGFKGLIPLLFSCQNNGGKLKCAWPFKARGCAQETSQRERKPHWVLSEEKLWSHCAIHLAVNPLPSLSSVSQILGVVCSWRVLKFFKEKGKRSKAAVTPTWKKKRREKVLGFVGTHCLPSFKMCHCFPVSLTFLRPSLLQKRTRMSMA